MAEKQTELFIKAITAIAVKCSRTLTSSEVQEYMLAFQGLSPEGVVDSLREVYAGLAPGAKMPSPADLRKKLAGPAMDPELAAFEGASRAMAALSRFGRALNAEHGNEIRGWIGDIGWLAVEQTFGGWNAFCDSTTYENEGTRQAQLRNAAKVIAHKAKHGLSLDAPMSLPGIPLPAVNPAVQLALSARHEAICQTVPIEPKRKLGDRKFWCEFCGDGSATEHTLECARPRSKLSMEKIKGGSQ